MQLIQISDNVGSWVLCSLEHSYMYKIVLCSLFYLFSCYQNFKYTENIYFKDFSLWDLHIHWKIAFSLLFPDLHLVQLSSIYIF